MIRPYARCSKCGFTVRRALEDITAPAEECQRCGGTARIQFTCSTCGSKFPYGRIVKEELLVCPLCGSEAEKGVSQCPDCGATLLVDKAKPKEIIIEKAREKRKILGKIYEEDIESLREVLGIDDDTAEILCGNGYNQVWKLKRATIKELTRTGLKYDDARKIKATAKEVRAKASELRMRMQEIIEQEYECPVCTLTVSGFDDFCYSCGTLFITEVDERVVPYDISRKREGISTLAFFDDKLLEYPEDPVLWFSRGVLLRSMKKYEKALDSIDRALELNPFLRNAWILKADVLTKMRRYDEAAFCYKKGVEEEVGITDEEIQQRREELKWFLSRLSEERCSFCGATVFVGTKLCPLCGKSLTEPEEPEALEEEEEAPAPKLTPLEYRKDFPKLKPLGLINGRGLVNGRGKVNGLINGHGLINGSSLTNLKMLKPRPVFSRLSAIGVSLLLIASVLVLMYPPEEVQAGIVVDGSFDDWSKVPILSDPFQSVSNPSINMSRYAIDSRGDQLSFFIEVEGQPFARSSNLDSFYVLIDGDADLRTGYSLLRLGADYMVEISGQNGTIMAHRALSFNASRSSDDWGSWFVVGGARAAYSGSRIETQISSTLMPDISEGFRAMLYSEDDMGNLTHSSIAFGIDDYPSVLVVQRGMSDRIITPAPNTQILTVELRAIAETHPGSISIIDSFSNVYEFTVSGGVLSQGGYVSLQVVADTTMLASRSGELVTFSILELKDDQGVSIEFQLEGQPAVCYVSSPPAKTTIDGWFGDWTNQSLRSDTDPGPMVNVNTNMEDYFAIHDRSEGYAFFYFSVEGEAFAGLPIPKLFEKIPSIPSIPGPPGLPPPRLGEDVARIYIDSNSSVPSSCFLHDIFPDAMIEIRGKNGEIRGHTLYLCQGGAWSAVDDPESQSANDLSQVEISMSLTYTPDVGNTRIVFTTTDWRKEADKATLETSWGTRSRTRAIYTVESTTSPSTSTAFSTQRKLFYDGTSFWAFYYNGTDGDTLYEHSYDGEDWSGTPEYAFTTSEVNVSSLWYDSANRLVYIVGDDATDDTSVVVRRGSVSPSDKEINWGTEETVVISGLSIGSKATFICKAADGRIWIVSGTMEGALNNFNLAARRSTDPDDISAWDTRIPLRDNPVVNRYVFPIILPLSQDADDADAYALWYANGNIEGKKWENSTSLWGSQESVATTTSGVDYKGPSAVVDSSGAVHAIYSNRTGRINYTIRQSSGSWSPGPQVDGGPVENLYPTLTLVTGSDPESLYSFYIRSNQIYCKNKTLGPGGWTSFSLTPNTDTKMHLTSIYSVSSINHISWEWLTIDGSDYKVDFERIPEFADVLAPLTFTLLIPIVLRRRKK